MSTPSARTDDVRPASRTAVQTAALIVGVVFLLVGIAGFIPGITTDYDTMEFASPDSHAHLLGIFQVSILHNIVHLVFGVAGIAMARAIRSARLYLVGGGIIYLVLFLYGMIVPESSSANFVPMNGADHVLHLVLGLGMILLGVVLTRSRPEVDRGQGARARSTQR